MLKLCNLVLFGLVLLRNYKRLRKSINTLLEYLNTINSKKKTFKIG